MFLVLVSFLLGTPLASTADGADPILVFSAASMTDVLPRVADGFTARTGVPVRFSFAGSSTLARQIDQGAPADVFVSANLDWVAFLEDRGRLDPGSRLVFASNHLVVVSPADGSVTVDEMNWAYLPNAFEGRLAMANPDHVPAGRYARQALERLGLWDALAARLAVAHDVRGALAYVASGACDLGIVYATDARLTDRVRRVATFPDSVHAPIRYTAGVVSESTHPQAREFVRFLGGPRARPVLESAGFPAPSVRSRSGE